MQMNDYLPVINANLIAEDISTYQVIATIIM